MQLAVSILLGLIVGVALFLATRNRPSIAVWTAIALGAAGFVLLAGSLSGWFLRDLGRAGAIALGLLSGTATALAVGCLVRGERRPVNWVALAVAAPPVLFFVAFGIGELLGPPH